MLFQASRAGNLLSRLSPGLIDKVMQRTLNRADGILDFKRLEVPRVDCLSTFSRYLFYQADKSRISFGPYIRALGRLTSWKSDHWKPRPASMASAHERRPSSLLSAQYILGVYVPSALLLVVTALVKREWVPFAVIIAASSGAWTFWSNRAASPISPSIAEVQKVLKPDVYQEFPLQEKTVLSHNVAM